MKRYIVLYRTLSGRCVSYETLETSFANVEANLLHSNPSFEIAQITLLE